MRGVAGEIEFEWDDENTAHLAAHRVTPAEFEELMGNDPVDVNFEVIGDEDRYRSVGLTGGGRLVPAVWTIRDGRIRAITAFRASVWDRKVFLRNSR